jgi:hypothetical protein
MKISGNWFFQQRLEPQMIQKQFNKQKNLRSSDSN